MASDPTTAPIELGVRIVRWVSEGKPFTLDGEVVGAVLPGAREVGEVADEEEEDEEEGVVRVMVVEDAATSVAQWVWDLALKNISSRTNLGIHNIGLSSFKLLALLDNDSSDAHSIR